MKVEIVFYIMSISCKTVKKNRIFVKEKKTFRVKTILALIFVENPASFLHYEEERCLERNTGYICTVDY